MVQEIPSVPIPPFTRAFVIIIFYFFIFLFLEKLQMTHGGAGRFIQKPHGGA